MKIRFLFYMLHLYFHIIKLIIVKRIEEFDIAIKRTIFIIFINNINFNEFDELKDF